MSLNSTQIINTVLARCGRQEGNSYFVTQASVELQLIQDRLEAGAFMPWFILSTEQTLSTVAATRALALPTDFLRENEDFPLYLYDATATTPYTKLNKDEFDVLESKYADSTATTPLEYAISGTDLDFFPTPDAIYTLKWKYYQKQSNLSAVDSSNAWTINAADLLIAELGLVMAGQYKLDAPRAQIFAQDIIRANARLLAFDEARKQQNRDAQMGDAT